MFSFFKRFSLPENKLRAMYRLGVTAGLEQARRASGPLAQLPPARPITPLPAPATRVRADALTRAYHNTRMPKKVLLVPLPAFERQLWEESPTIVFPATRPLPDVD